MVKILALWSTLLLLGLVGCASVPLSLDQCNATRFGTAMEHEACLSAAEDHRQLQHELEDKKNIKRDELIVFLNACDRSTSHILVETIKAGRSLLPSTFQGMKAFRELGYRYTHENVSQRARIHDFQCVTAQELKDSLERLRY